MKTTEQSVQCLHCKNPQCVQGCPLSNAIPQFISLVENGNFAGASNLLGHPFGAVCAGICPFEQQCEGSCIRNKTGRPVAIAQAEQQAFLHAPWKLRQKTSLLKGKTVAVIGGGVSGLTFAGKMLENGAHVTVFEQDKLLSTLKLIPSYRLDGTILQQIEDAFCGAIAFENKKVTAQMLKDISTRYNYVYVAVGCTKNRTVNIEGEQFAVTFKDCLQRVNTGNIVVLGGGNTAMDCATLSAVQGAHVTVAYRRTESDMPAFAKEIETAKKHGVNFVFNVAPIAIRQQNGKQVLTLAKTVSDGRGKLVVTDETLQMHCDSVVTALGATSEDLGIERPVSAGKLFANVYAGGDYAGGSLAVHAVRDALAVAKSIIDQLYD